MLFQWPSMMRSKFFRENASGWMPIRSPKGVLVIPNKEKYSNQSRDHYILQLYSFDQKMSFALESV